MAENVFPLKRNWEMFAQAVGRNVPDTHPDQLPSIDVLAPMQAVHLFSESLMNGELETTPDPLGRDLALVREARQLLGKLEERIENRMYEVMPSKVYVVAGVGTFERRAGKEYKKPKTPDILRRLIGVARRLNVDITTGEQQLPSDEAFLRVLQDACRVEGWRITYLRGHDIDPEDYFTVERSRDRVQFTPET